MPFEVMMLLSTLPWLAVLGGAGYLSLRFVRAFERRGIAQSDLEALRSRVTELEGQIEGMQVQVERLADEQSFTTRLLSERSTS